jgi:Cu+-exporting ATPase
VVTAIRLSRATMRNIRQNLFFALVYNGVGIPIAAGVLYPILGIRLSPMFAAATMALSSLSVVGNANRLRRYRLADLPAAVPSSVEPQVETGADHTAPATHSHGSAGRPDAETVDPVCGMAVTPDSAAAHRDTTPGTLHFCSTGYADIYDTDPDRYTATPVHR